MEFFEQKIMVKNILDFTFYRAVLKTTSCDACILFKDCYFCTKSVILENQAME